MALPAGNVHYPAKQSDRDLGIRESYQVECAGYALTGSRDETQAADCGPPEPRRHGLVLASRMQLLQLPLQ